MGGWHLQQNSPSVKKMCCCALSNCCKNGKLILTRELSDNTLSWQQQDLRCQVELISCSSYVCSFGSATLFVPPTNPFVTSCFFFQCPIHFILGICILSSVHHFSDSCWLSSGRWPVAARAAAAIDSSWPATATCCFRGWSAQRLRRWTWNHCSSQCAPFGASMYPMAWTRHTRNATVPLPPLLPASKGLATLLSTASATTIDGFRFQLNVEGHPVLESIFFSRFAVPTQPLAGTCSRTPQALKRCVAVHWATVARMVRDL